MGGFVIAGTHSGSGKTTVTLGLLDLCRRKGLKVQPFKAGPDFIDPSLHTSLAGRISRNLDSFLLSPAVIRHLYAKSSETADISVIEGVAGLYDGYSGLDSRGSTSEISKILDCPVILVVDAGSSARSVAAVVKGFQKFDEGVNIAGVFINRLSGPKHLEWCKSAIEKECGIPVLGFFYQSDALEMKERHMGLVPSSEKKLADSWLSELRRQMNSNTRWKDLLKISKSQKSIHSKNPYSNLKSLSKKIRIGVARDKAFNFYYEDSLDLLRDLGAEIVPFSPIRDKNIPKSVDSLYFGGGFPEMYGEELAGNRSIKADILKSVREGLPVYAECGGLMYLGQTIKDHLGEVHEMVGAFDYTTAMTPKITMAYLSVKAKTGNLLAKKGESFPGQVFHFSEMKPKSSLKYSWTLSDGRNTFQDGIKTHNALASYLHIHLWSRPSLAQNWIKNI